MVGFIDGASFILDIPDTIPALWGSGQRVLWPKGESLMICGMPGLGKTTLAGMLASAQLGGIGDVEDYVLGLPVTQVPGKILYLAMDRPAQIARSLTENRHGTSFGDAAVTVSRPRFHSRSARANIVSAIKHLNPPARYNLPS